MTDLAALGRFETQFGSAGRTLSRLIRPAIAAPAGRTLVWGDWSAIEACVLPWLADTRASQSVLDVILGSHADKNKPDLYCREAAGIAGIELDQFWDDYRNEVDGTGEQRQTGKVAVLSLGFGGAVGALQAMAVGYGISLTEAEAKVIVDKWRANNPWARNFWDALWDAFTSAMENPDTPYAVGRVVYMYDKGYLGGSMLCFLPDGRPLVYPSLRWRTVEREDYEGNMVKKTELSYRRGRTTRSLWYGVLAENITQATAASLLRELLVKLDPAPVLEGGDTVRLLPPTAQVDGHTHDEAIVECDDNEDEVARTSRILREAMETRPSWGDGLPLQADITTNWYYTKSKL